MICKALCCVFVLSLCCRAQFIPEKSAREEANCGCQGQRETSNQRDFIKLSSRQMRSHVARAVPLARPALGNQIRLNGVMEIQVRFGSDGKVACAAAVSGNPLAVASAMEAVPKWSFKPVVDAKGRKHGGCGRLRIAYRFSDTESSTSVQ